MCRCEGSDASADACAENPISELTKGPSSQLFPVHRRGSRSILVEFCRSIEGETGSADKFEQLLMAHLSARATKMATVLAES